MTAVSPTARTLAALALGLGVLLPFASLPPFALGYWDKAEPLVVGLHAVAALAAFALAAAAVRTPAVVLACLRHPFVLLPMALGLWSAVVAPVMALPRLSLTGAPQSGFGALWHLDTALLIAAARLVRSDGVLWRRLGRLAAAAVAAAAALKAFDWAWERAGGGHLLIWVASYYGWLGLALPVVVLGQGESRRRRLAVLAVAVAAVLAGRAVGLGVAAVTGLVLVVVLGRNARGWLAAGLAAVAAVAPGVVLMVMPGLDGVASLVDRRSLLSMVGAELSGWSWAAWLTGIGWGRTQDVFQANLQASGMRLWDGSWIFMSSDYFNSHNALTESLLAAGLPGLLLTLAWPLALPIACDPARRRVAAGFAVTYAMASAIWFPLALGQPMIALAAAALAPAPEPVGGKGGRTLLVGLPALAGLVLAGLAGVLVQHGGEVAAARSAIMAGAAAPPPIPADPRGGDLAAAAIIRDAFSQVEAADGGERRRFSPAARMMVDYLRRRIPETRTVLLPVTGLSLMAQFQVLESLTGLDHDIAPSAHVWAEWLDRGWQLAPGRSDLAIPLFTRMAAAGRNDLLEAGVQRVLRRNRHDPVGLYFFGLLMVQMPDPTARRAGLDALRASVDAGLERSMPLDPGLRTLLDR